MKQRDRLIKRTGIKLLVFLAAVALLSPLLANHRPLYMKYNGFSFFPAFSTKHIVTTGNETVNYDFTDFKNLKTDFIIYAPIPWSPGKSDYLNSNVSPFDNQFFLTNLGNTIEMPVYFRHWLGTNNLGADVLSGLIHGFRYSFYIAIVALFVASFFGITLGLFAGYFGNTKLQKSRASTFSFLLIFSYLLFLFLNRGVFELQQSRSPGNFHIGILLFIILCTSLLFYQIIKFFLISANSNYFKKEITIPLDNVISRSIEITMAMPRLILIITLAAIVRPSLMNLGIIIGFSLWTELARFTRAQAIQLREMDFVTSARAMGFQNARILFKHILINSMGPVIVVMCFAFSNVILTESGLSFLGVGIPRQVVTWGSMLSAARENTDAWWLTLFPGCCILLTVLLFNKLADSYSKNRALTF